MKDALQKSRWTELLSDRENFGQFLSFIRESKVKTIELDGIRIDFQDAKYVTAGAPQADRLPELTDEQKKQEEEAILFHSSG